MSLKEDRRPGGLMGLQDGGCKGGGSESGRMGRKTESSWGPSGEAGRATGPSNSRLLFDPIQAMPKEEPSFIAKLRRSMFES